MRLLDTSLSALLCVGAAVACGSAQAQQQEAAEAPQAPGVAVVEEGEAVRLDVALDERVEGSAQVSTPMIAGMIVGPFRNTLDFSLLRFYLPQGAQAAQLCFSAVSRNGAYSASPASQPVAVPVGARAVYPGFRGAGLAAGYRTEDVAVRARYGAKCRYSAQSPYVPAAYGRVFETLTIMVQSRRSASVSVRLRDTSGKISAVSCVADSDRSSVRFDTLCRIPLNGLNLSGRSSLTLEIVDDRGRTVREAATILWPL